MNIGLALPQIGRFADPTQTRDLATVAEAAGYSSLWVLDRLLAPERPRSAYPGTADGTLPPEQHRAMDPLLTLTLAAAVTKRIELGTNVLVAPWYPPMLLARSLASLDLISRGRLQVGLGLGWSADEYAAVGVPQRNLGRRMEEILHVLNRAWSDDTVELATSRETVAPASFAPKPAQHPRPPILLAAYTPAGLERAARLADGWTPAGLPADVLAPMWADVRSRVARAGRDLDAFRLVVRANVKVVPGLSDGGRPPFVGSIEQIRGDVAATESLGAHELVLDLQGATRSVQELLDVAATLTHEVALAALT